MPLLLIQLILTKTYSYTADFLHFMQYFGGQSIYALSIIRRSFLHACKKVSHCEYLPKIPMYTSILGSEGDHHRSFPSLLARRPLK